MSKHRTTRGLCWAALWILVGIVWLLSNRGIIPRDLLSWERDWPIVFVLIGLMMLWNIMARRKAVPAPGVCEVTAAPGGEGGRRLRVVVNEDGRSRVNLTVPLSVAGALLKLGGHVIVRLPERARASLREKGIDFETMPADELIEALRACAAHGPIELVNVVDDDGTTVRICIE